MTASNQALVGYYAEHCHPQLRGQAVYVQLADQSADFKRDAMPQVGQKIPAHVKSQRIIHSFIHSFIRS